MKAELKEKWLNALRTKKYRKARGRLYNPRSGGYCAMGILGREAGQDALELIDREGLNQAALKKMGLRASDQYNITLLNDSEAGFDKVIEYIEMKL